MAQTLTIFAQALARKQPATHIPHMTKNPTQLSKVGVTFAAVSEIAKFYGQAPSSIWRVAVGQTTSTRVHAGVLRALLAAGWTPGVGIGQVLADLAARETPMPTSANATAEVLA